MGNEYHHNWDMSGNVPLSLNDRYFGQDIQRDFWNQREQIGKAVKDVIGQNGLYVKNGTIEKGANFDDIDIPECIGYAEYDVEVQDEGETWQEPALTKTVTLESIRVRTPAVADFDISGATLDGSTVNYLKMAYQESNGRTRSRQFAAGTWNFERVQGVLITANSTSPTSKEVLLATFIGDDSSFLSIIESELIILVKEGISYKNIPLAMHKIGAGFTITDVTFPQLTYIDSTHVALWNFNTTSLGMYVWDGDSWSLDGSALTIGGATSGTAALATLDSTHIVFFDATEALLKTYAWSGSAWSLDGSGLSIPGGADVPGLTALDSTHVALALTGSIDELRTYAWSGSAWSLDGSGLDISGKDSVQMTALNPTHIALLDTTEEELTTYLWDGSTWSQVGSVLLITGAATFSLVGINASYIVFMDSNIETFATYYWNGSVWEHVGRDLAVTGVGTLSCTSMDDDNLVFIDVNGDELTTYKYQYQLIGN